MNTACSPIWSHAFWQGAGAAGIMSDAIEEAHGGVDGDVGFEAVALYEQARLGDVNWGFDIQSIVQHYISFYGTEAQKARWLPGLKARMSFAVTTLLGTDEAQGQVMDKCLQLFGGYGYMAAPMRSRKS